MPNNKRPHELTERYVQEIRFHFLNAKKAIYIGLSLTVGGCALSVFGYGRMNQSFLFGACLGFGLILVTFGVGTIMAGAVSDLLQANRWRRMRNIAVSYPAYVGIGVENAHRNVRDWLTNPSERVLNPRLFKSLVRRFVELEKISTQELKDRLTRADIWNPYNGWYEKGRSLDEGLMMVIYVKRVDKETVAAEATKATYEKTAQEAANAADFQARKNAEQRKQTVESELNDILGRRTQRYEPLPALNGICVLHFFKEQPERAVFTLPVGEYTIELYDFEQEWGDLKKLVIERDGEPFEFALLGRVANPQRTELTIRKRGDGEEYRFVLG